MNATTTAQPMTDFERGARAAIEAFGAYFRDENDGLFAGFCSYLDDHNPDAGTEWRFYTDNEFDEFASGALRDAIWNERHHNENATTTKEN